MSEEGDTSQLFYAYARRTDNYSHSRYLLTFSSADVCKEWWTLIQSEYPDQGIRHGPQLFSFQGDNFPSKPATNKKFEHLKTQWFYTQFGDASGTSGRQDIIPLQGWDGQVKSGSAGSGAKSGTSETENLDQQKAASSSIDMGALGDSLKAMQAIIEKNNTQITQLVDSQAQGEERVKEMTNSIKEHQDIIEKNNAQISQLTQSQAQAQERQDRIEKMVEENAQQLKAMNDSHLKVQQQNQAASNENAKQLQALRNSYVKAQQQTRELVENNAKTLQEIKLQREQQQQQQEAIQAQGPKPVNGVDQQCPHNVYPPPRKIDKQLVGYAYGQDSPKRPKARAVKRPDSTKPTENGSVVTNR